MPHLFFIDDDAVMLTLRQSEVRLHLGDSLLILKLEETLLQHVLRVDFLNPKQIQNHVVPERVSG